MNGFLALIRRNTKLYFKDKGMFFASLITPVILLVLALLCTLVRPALRMLTRPDPSRLGLFFAPAFLCMILCMSVPENMLFVTPGLGSFLFYWMSGYLLSDGEAERMGGNKG